MQIACPSCQKQLRVPDAAAGKTVKCPACGTMFPAVDTVEELVQDAPPRRVPKAAPPPAHDEVQENLPRRSRPRGDEDDELPRRSRRPDDDDDEDDDRPARRRRPRDEDDDDDRLDVRGSSRKQAQRVGRAAALWFLIAG